MLADDQEITNNLHLEQNMHLLYDQVLFAQIWTILPWEITKTIFHCFPI